ncbi:MAG: MBL fold metallo-hydrolase [Terriglobales bacterium]
MTHRSARLRVLGSGTSTGVPMLGCHCPVCTSTDPRDRRLRPSILLRQKAEVALIDTTPDFRAQALAAGLDRLDAVLFTHSHADHIFGLDDIRQLNFARPGPIPVYADQRTLADLRRVFQYVFANDYAVSAIPQISAQEIPAGISPRPAITAAGIEFEPIEVMHGALPITAYRFGRNAYVTDFSELPPAAKGRLRGLDLLILDALRHRPHPTHSSLANSLGLVAELAPRRAFFTHLCHDLPHAETEAALPPHVRLAYDGLELEVEV